jgi:peptidoglycan hydrolase CwlO-like protein
MDFKKLTNRAKGLVDKRGGTDALKDDLSELKDIAKGKGSVGDKAKAAAAALKDPGAKGEDTAAKAPAAEAPAAEPAAAEPAEPAATPAPPTGSAPQPPQGA